jgi:putative membrane protein
MDKNLTLLFTTGDVDRIKAAVREAEGQTSGEIVPYVVARSDDYEEAEWRGGFLLATIALAGTAVYDFYTARWLLFGPAEVALAGLLAGIAGLLLVKWFHPLKRLLAGRPLLRYRVQLRAAEAFIAEEVFATRHRTGILLFISILEHEVLVVGDAGINSKVEKFEWEGVVRRIVAGIRKGKPADGLVDAIRECGELLRRAGVDRRPDDTNELDDRLRSR